MKNTNIVDRCMGLIADNASVGAQRWLNKMLSDARHKVQTVQEKLTPELAAALIARNDDNRQIKAQTVKRYASDIRSGRWDFNGEPIIVSSSGTLNDGQHRCLAVIESGISLDMLFVFGVSRESRLTTDQGSQKTAGDYLAMEGVKNANQVAASATLIIQVERFGKVVSGVNQLKPSKSEIRERVLCDDGISRSFRIAKRASRVAPATLLTAFHYLASQADVNAADDFLHKLASGAELRERDPIFVVREKLMRSDLRLNNNERMKALVMAWNAWRQGRDVRTVTHTIRKGEKLPEMR